MNSYTPSHQFPYRQCLRYANPYTPSHSKAPPRTNTGSLDLLQPHPRIIANPPIRFIESMRSIIISSKTSTTPSTLPTPLRRPARTSPPQRPGSRSQFFRITFYRRIIRAKTFSFGVIGRWFTRRGEGCGAY